MGRACSLSAHVRNSKGEVVESKLWQDLSHYTSNRELTKEYYTVGTNEEFLNKVRDKEEFEVDENGEITFKALKTLARIDLDTDKLIETLNKDIKSGKYSYAEALKKVQYFNENSAFSDKVLATMVHISGDQYFVSVVPTSKKVTDNKGKKHTEAINTDEKQKLHDTVRNKEMEQRIIDLLKRHQVSVKFLEGTKQGGRYSTENISQAENGLYGLIEVIQTGHTTDILAEEAGHFAVGALGEHTIVQRLESLLEDEHTQREVLGEDYDTTSLGYNPAREVAGRLVGKALQRKLGKGSMINILANRVANFAKRVFYNFTGNEVRWAAAKAEQTANKIAYQFVEGNSKFSVHNALNIEETLRDASLSINVSTYTKTMNELGRLSKRLDSIADDAFAGELKATLGLVGLAGSDNLGKSALQYDEEQAEVMADSLAFDGIVQAVSQLSDYLGGGSQIDQLMGAVDLHNPAEFYANMARNGRYLRQARTFLKSAEIIIDIIQDALDSNNYNGILKSNGESLEDAKYQDKFGTWHSINFKNTLTSCKAIIGKKKSSLNNLESNYFIRFCENIYGSKYVNTAAGMLWTNIWNGEDGSNDEQMKSIADMVQGNGVEDIDIFHRFLGSMANNPDIIGQIVDKLVKSANKDADDQTRKWQEQLSILKDRADKLGLNMDDLIERDENGVPTGNIITPPAQPTEHGNLEEDFICNAYIDDMGSDDHGVDDVYAVDHGKWERARDELKKAAWEEFKTLHPDWKGMTGLTRGMHWDKFFRPKMKAWNKKNSIKVKVRDDAGNVKYVKWVPNAIYKTDAWEKLEKKYPRKTDAKDSLRRWMNDYMEIKQKLDALLPNGTTLSYRLPQFRGTFGNSVRNKAALETGHFKNTKARFKTFGRRVILESFMETAEEEDFGDLHTMNSPDEELLGTKLDYESERASRLPVFGINKLKNMNDLSTDILHSTLAYASMAETYNHLSQVVDALEVGKSVLYRRELSSSTASKNVKGLIKSITPTKYEEEDTGSKNYAYSRYLKFLDKQVYGISSPYKGFTIWKGKRILINKIFQNLSSLGGSMFLKGNVLGGAVNTLTGFNNIVKEAAVGDYFNLNDFRWANKYYRNSFVSMWSPRWMGGDLGQLIKQNRLDLFLEHMNASSNNREKFRNWHTNRSSLNNFYRMAGYLPYSSGDHWMQAMSYLAVAHGTNLYDTDGQKEANLWDAWQKKPNTDDKQEFSYGYTLEFDKFSPLNANEITSSSLEKSGVYLKEAKANTESFHNWLYSRHPEYLDSGYKSQHEDEYNDLRATFNSFDKKYLMQLTSNRYNTLKSILSKVEDYLNAAKSPVLTPESPDFSDIFEFNYLQSKGLGTGDYKNILTAVREDIYNLIWTKSDESAYMDKCREINNRLHGIYNEQDKTAWHNQIYTNAFLAMKGWALGYLESIYSNNHYSVALDKNTEGFVNTAFKVPISALLGAYYKNKNSMSFWDVMITMINPWSKRSKKAMLKAGFTEEQNMNARRMAASAFLMTFLLMIGLATAPPDEDDEEDIEDMSLAEGLCYYLCYRTLLEQRAFLEPSEMFIQSGSLMDFVPVGVAALADAVKLLYEGAGALVGDEDNENFFYQSDASNESHEAGDAKAKQHLIRLIPYVKSWWAITHPYEAKDNYEFGRKLRTR